MKIIERIFDSISGEISDIERSMDSAELLDYEQSIARAQFLFQQEAEAQAKRQALLDKLGITEEEARLLLGGN